MDKKDRTYVARHTGLVGSTILRVLHVQRNDNSEIVNIGVGEDLKILKLATMIKKEVGFHGTMGFDKSHPTALRERCLMSRKFKDLAGKSLHRSKKEFGGWFDGI